MTNEKFHNFVFLDETTVELRYTSIKRWYINFADETSTGKVGKLAHNIKVHVLAGISREGATSAIIFRGKMDARGFTNLFDSYIKTFFRNRPEMRLIMDGAPSHTSVHTREYLQENNIIQFKTPAQSPVITWVIFYNLN